MGKCLQGRVVSHGILRARTRSVGDNLVRRAYKVGVRDIVAPLVAIVLLSLLAICPIPACGMTLAQHGCCHKPHAQPHCPMPTVQDCPYFILEKGKTVPSFVGFAPVIVARTTANSWVQHHSSTIRTEFRLSDSAGLYLRVRALLI